MYQAWQFAVQDDIVCAFQRPRRSSAPTHARDMASSTHSDDTLVPLDTTDRVDLCKACGSTVRKINYQARAADEAHTTVWSCDNCPLNSRRISLSGPPTSAATSFPRVYHRRAVSTRDSRTHRRAGTTTCIEMYVPTVSYVSLTSARVENVRSAQPVRTEDYPVDMKGYMYREGEYAGKLIVHRSSETLCPHTSLVHTDTYDLPPVPAEYPYERDGFVSKGVYIDGTEYFLHSRLTERGYVHSVVIPLPSESFPSVRRGLMMAYSLLSVSMSMKWMVNTASSSHVHNLSPRAWDVLEADEGSHLFTEKIDGERCYVLAYDSCMYMFRKGGGYPMVGWRVLSKRTGLQKPVILDVENTITHGLFLIDMLTDSSGNPSPPGRTMTWVLSQFSAVRTSLAPLNVHVRRYHATQAEAERMSKSVPYLTDGIMAIRIDGTSAKKIKSEKAVELRLNSDMSLTTSDGDIVVKKYPDAHGVVPGDIVELKFRLSKTGKTIFSREAFRRFDKSDANSTSATLNILRSFRGVTKDEETRRRAVLMWCDSLRTRLMIDALEQKSPKSIVLDIGTGTGQSLDVLTPGKGVSYILVEPDASRVEMLKRRTGGAKILTEPRELLGHVKHLKSGSATYVILNCPLEDIIDDEEVSKLLSQEVRVATAVFSAQYVTAALYDLVNFWSIPVVGCMYPYDGVDVGESIVDALGVRMQRVSKDECTVQWGGDKVYTEPYTTSIEYKAFSTVFRASDIQDLPNREMDEDACEVCSKIFVIKS